MIFNMNDTRSSGGGNSVTLSDNSAYVENMVNYASSEIAAAWQLILEDMQAYGEATVDLNSFADLVTMSLGELYYAFNALNN